LREWRKKNRSQCECGKPATVKRSGGAVCEWCAKLETAREKSEQRKIRYGYKYGGLSEHALGVKI
jgi:hypothetical protein